MTKAATTDTAASIPDLYRDIWKYALGTRIKLAWAMVLLIASQLTKLAAPYCTAKAIDSLQQGGTDNVWTAGMWVGAVLAVYVGSWALHGPGRVLERAVGVRVRQTMSDALYARLARAPLQWHEQHHSGDLQHRVAQSAGALSSFAQTQFVYVQSVISFVGPLVALVLLSPSIGALAIINYIIVSVLIMRFDTILMRLAVEENKAERRYSSGLLDFLGNISTIASLRLQEPTRRLIGQRLEAVFTPLKRLIVLNEVKWGAVDIISVSLTWGLVVVFVWQSRSSGSTMLIGSLFMIYQYAQQAGGVIASMASNFQQVARTRTDVASAEPIWQAPEQVSVGGAIGGWKQIDIADLTYSRDAKPVASLAEGTPAPRGSLDHVSLTLRRGERIALVGPSGSGKSTLMRVLAGLYEPGSATVREDGASKPGVTHLGAISTLIPQEADVFESTVRENITFGEAVDDAQINAAIWASAFGDVLVTMPQGLDTPISERGFNMSGGQRQRLCLARGVLAARDSSLIFLDEPTSALDAITETMVIDRMSEHFRHACIVASVHRMALLSHFDRVLLMVAGRIVDHGAPHEVAARQPLFAEMLQGRKVADQAAGEHVSEGVPAEPASAAASGPP